MASVSENGATLDGGGGGAGGEIVGTSTCSKITPLGSGASGSAGQGGGGARNSGGGGGGGLVVGGQGGGDVIDSCSDFTGWRGGGGGSSFTGGVGVSGASVDDTPTPPPGLNGNGEVVTASYACADAPNAPGIATCTGTLPTGARIDTSRVGRYTVTVTATSIDGLSTTSTVNQTIVLPSNAFYSVAAQDARQRHGRLRGQSPGARGGWMYLRPHVTTTSPGSRSSCSLHQQAGGLAPVPVVSTAGAEARFRRAEPEQSSVSEGHPSRRDRRNGTDAEDHRVRSV
jgi:hypothetical protein